MFAPLVNATLAMEPVRVEGAITAGFSACALRIKTKAMSVGMSIPLW